MPSQTEASKKSAMSTKRGGVAVDSLTSQSNGKHGKKGNKAGVAKVASMQAKTSLPHKDPPRDLAREFTPNDTSNEITQQTSPINPRKRKNAEPENPRNRRSRTSSPFPRSPPAQSEASHETRAASPMCRKTKLPKTSVYTGDIEAAFQALQDTCRMYYLVNFHLQDEHRIIRSVWGENIRKSTWEWAESAKRIRWHGNNWRTSMIEFMKVKVSVALKEDKERDDVLAIMTEIYFLSPNKRLRVLKEHFGNLRLYNIKIKPIKNADEDSKNDDEVRCTTADDLFVALFADREGFIKDDQLSKI